MFDQTSPVVVSADSHGREIKDIPIMYTDNGTVQSNCSYSDMEFTNGQILFSGSIYIFQESCKANTGNAGNYYSWPSSTAGGSSSEQDYIEPNSICPKGWQLTASAASEPKSWYHLFRISYSINDKNDSKLLPNPFVFVGFGMYASSITYRKNAGRYWTSTCNGKDAYFLGYNIGTLDPQYSSSKSYGFSIRCVSR